MSRLRARHIVGALMLIAFGLQPGFAAVIGNLNVGTGGTATVSLSSLVFNPDPSSVPSGPPWNAEVATGTTLVFDSGPLAVREGILINGGNPLTPASIPGDSFMVFAAHPNLVFSVISLAAGSANTNCATAIAVGQSCSVYAGSPVILTRTPTGSSASFSVNGLASDTGVAGIPTGSPYVGTFSNPLVTPLPNGALPTPENIQLYLCPSGTCTAEDFASNRSITSPFGGQFFATAVPEPGSLGLMGLALVGLAYGSRRASRFSGSK